MFLQRTNIFTQNTTEGLVQQAFGEIAGLVVNSHLSFARTLVVTENTRLRSPQPREAWER